MEETFFDTVWKDTKGAVNNFFSTGIFGVISHPIDNLATGANAIASPVADFLSSTLWKVIVILVLVLVGYILFKKEVEGLIA
jgi:predicted Abi (CAAX) family protease